MPQLIDELETARIFKDKEDYVTHLWWEGRPEAYVIFHSPTLAQALKLTAHRVTGKITSDLSRLTPADVMPESRLATPRFGAAFVGDESIDDFSYYDSLRRRIDDALGYEPEDASIECIDDFSYEDEPPPPNQWDATVDAALLSEDITL